MFKNIKNIIILFVVAVFISGIPAVFAASESAQQIEAKRNEAKQNIQKLKLLERMETNKLYRNQQKLEQNAVRLQQDKQRYDSTHYEISNLQYQLEQALASYSNQKNATNKRLIQIYKKKRKNYVEFLFSARDLNNLLDRIYFENIVMKIDKQKLYETQMKTRRIRELRAKIESQRSYLEVNMKSMKRQQKNIEQAINQNEKLIEKLKTDRATWEKSERELARQSVAIGDMINKSVKEDKTSSIVVTGGFLRPVGGPITSPYGYRTHPIFKKTIFHSGIDIGAPMNTPIKAAQSGKCIFAGWYGGYGKVVILDHGKIDGKPTTTLYAHMNSYNASVGNNYAKGSVIGRVGTTGYSTGPHLHFEVRVSGNTVNPLNYVSR